MLPFANRKCNNFHPRTPFSIILDSLESSHRAQQDYAEKHHSPRKYNKTKWGKIKTLFRKPKMPDLLQLKSELSKTNFVRKRMTNATFENGKQVVEILQRSGRDKSPARMNRQNLQYRNRKRRRKSKPFSVNLEIGRASCRERVFRAV